MDGYGDGNTYRDVVCRDSETKTFGWRIDMHKEAIDEYIKNLRCCGNCKYYQEIECPMAVFPVLLFPKPDEVCDNWTFDGRTHADRLST
jgi:hypothetical protein